MSERAKAEMEAEAEAEAAAHYDKQRQNYKDLINADEKRSHDLADSYGG